MNAAPRGGPRPRPPSASIEARRDDTARDRTPLAINVDRVRSSVSTPARPLDRHRRGHLRPELDHLQDRSRRHFHARTALEPVSSDLGRPPLGHPPEPVHTTSKTSDAAYNCRGHPAGPQPMLTRLPPRPGSARPRGFAVAGASGTPARPSAALESPASCRRSPSCQHVAPARRPIRTTEGTKFLKMNSRPAVVSSATCPAASFMPRRPSLDGAGARS